MTTETVRTARQELGRKLREFRQVSGYTQQELANLLGYSRPRVTGAENGEGCAFLFWQGCDRLLNAQGTLVARFRAIEALRHRQAANSAAAAHAARVQQLPEQPSEIALLAHSGAWRDELASETNRRIMLGQVVASEEIPDVALLAAAEAVRREVEDTLASGTISPARLDHLEETVANHIRIYTRTPPAQALAGLLVDFMDVRRLAAERQPAIIQARLSEVSAFLGILAADSLMKLGRMPEASAWYGTARIAADDSGNAELRARVRAQEAMRPYYYGHPAEAVHLARDAQGILGGVPRAAGALAAAAEARALARLGNQAEARKAIALARDLVSMVNEPDNDDAFQFGDRRLLFYESSTLTNLGDTAAAARVQEQALAQYGDTPGLIDPALIRLDQAQLLITNGDISTANELAQGILLSIPAAQRTLIFAARLRQIIAFIPSGHEARHTLKELQDQLTVPSTEEFDDRGA